MIITPISTDFMPDSGLGGSSKTLTIKATNKKKSTSTTKPKSLYEGFADYTGYNTVTRTGGGGYTPIKSDISGLLAAYDQQANSARDTAQRSYENTRSDLLTSLKRFQEQNAKDQKFQRQQYLEGQASLESAREQANRQNRISSAARGLSGSGLQQLAQLQNLISQSGDVSKLANENQEAMDSLRNLLMQQEEDHNTKMARNEQTLADTLNNIASTLATQKAQAIAENEAAYANAVNQARAAAASGTTTTHNTGNLIGTVLDKLNRDLKSVANSTKKYTTKSAKNKQAKALTDEAHATIQSLLEAYGDTGYYSTYKNDVDKALKSYGLATYYGNK